MIAINVSILNPQRVVFKGTASSVILPGESGVFEVLPFHKNIISRLISGKIFVDNRSFAIKRGVVNVKQNNVSIIVEE